MAVPQDRQGWRKSSYSGGGENSCVEVSWRKSSYSGGSGNGSCVEVSWRKSSRSGGGNNSCVEVAFGAETVGVRDSKNTGGPRLAFGAAGWQEFVTRLA